PQEDWSWLVASSLEDDGSNVILAETFGVFGVRTPAEADPLVMGPQRRFEVRLAEKLLVVACLVCGPRDSGASADVAHGPDQLRRQELGTLLHSHLVTTQRELFVNQKLKATLSFDDQGVDAVVRVGVVRADADGAGPPRDPNVLVTRVNRPPVSWKFLDTLGDGRFSDGPDHRPPWRASG